MKPNLSVALLLPAVLAAMIGLVSCEKEPATPLGSKANADSDIVTVSAEDLIKTPAKFSGHRVRVTGYWVQAFEQSYLQSDANTEKISPIWVERWTLPGGREIKNPQAITAAIAAAYKDVGKDRTMKQDVLLVTLEGFFDHKASIKATAESHPFQSGFGHLGQYQSQLTIERVVEIKFVSESATAI